MQAFFKDNELIINSQILDNEKAKLVEFTDKAEERGVEVIKLYDTNGNTGGIKFKLK